MISFSHNPYVPPTIIPERFYFCFPENQANERSRKASPCNFKMPASNDTEYLSTQPIVTIMVDSPKDPPNSEFGASTASAEPQTPSAETSSAQQASGQAAFKFDIPPPPPIDSNEPIDVNEPRDTSNIFYDYEEPKQPGEETSVIIEPNNDGQSPPAVDTPSTSGTNTGASPSHQSDNKNAGVNCSSSSSSGSASS